MTNDVSAPSVLEGAALPPPRAFGESNTLTVPRARRRRAGAELAARLVDAVGSADPVAGSVHLAVVPSDPTPITLTF